MAITFRFQVGDVVEAMDNSPHAWRLATIERRAAYRGREGYYVLWVLAPDAQSWVSRGGWKPAYGVRTEAEGRLAHVEAVRAIDAACEGRLRQEGVIGGRYEDELEQV